MYFAPSSKKIVNNNNNNNNDNNKTLSQVLIYEFCEIVKNIFLQNISGDYYNISGDYFLRQRIAKPIRKGIVISRSCCTTKLFHFLLFFVLFVHYGLMLPFIELFFYRNIYTINKLTLDKWKYKILLKFSLNSNEPKRYRKIEERHSIKNSSVLSEPVKTVEIFH